MRVISSIIQGEVPGVLTVDNWIRRLELKARANDPTGAASILSADGTDDHVRTVHGWIDQCEWPIKQSILVGLRRIPTRGILWEIGIRIQRVKRVGAALGQDRHIHVIIESGIDDGY